MGRKRRAALARRTSQVPPFFKAPRLLSIACSLSLLFLFLLFLLHVFAAEPERLSIYAQQARYSLNLSPFHDRPYVALFELLEPLASPELKAAGERWRLRMPDPRMPGRVLEAEFQEGSTTAKIRGQKITLSAPARVENQRLMLPLHGIGAVLIPLLGPDLTLHETARRLFLGGVAEPASTELRKGDPSTLAIQFPKAVSPTIASEGNSLKLTFTRDPVIAFSEAEVLNDKLFSSSSYAENNGAATFTITGTAPLLAKFADDGKTILITAAPAPPAGEASATPPAQTPSTGQPVSSAPGPTGEAPVLAAVVNPQAAARSPRAPGFLVVIDPGHGGGETGSRISPSLLEKDVTLSLARRLRQELQSRHIAVNMLRDGDVDVSLDQRAVAANLVRPAVFISLHAEPGTTLRIYTPALPAASDSTTDRNGFLPWQSAQAAFTADSRALATAAAEAIGKRQVTAQVRPAFLQPLHSIAAAAIAIEAPAESKGLRIPEDQIAAALADAIAIRKQAGGAQ